MWSARLRLRWIELVKSGRKVYRPVNGSAWRESRRSDVLRTGRRSEPGGCSGRRFLSNQLTADSSRSTSPTTNARVAVASTRKSSPHSSRKSGPAPRHLSSRSIGLLAMLRWATALGRPAANDFVLTHLARASSSTSSASGGAADVAERHEEQTRGSAAVSESTDTEAEPQAITVYFVERDGTRRPVQAKIGTSMLEVAHDNSIDLEGACEGSLACSTCHVYVSQPYYGQLQEPTDDENDMLDLAFGLKENSRLGCQIIARKELDGMEITLPQATRNMAVDGYVPKPH
ncbi:hypothetical protein CDCA_CDCA03G1015 [Cyanidium caldarium]|uniref:2Fe-2S ferredoxin-type domain-containing protein n=1 Tax=Cyanidium caldarium TaxID=2771 RepID=A0AAV9ISB7_CYACA|nr:hypothetical protein CDCA_CDCA03G1015 [Cyanidium caldarium]